MKLRILILVTISALTLVVLGSVALGGPATPAMPAQKPGPGMSPSAEFVDAAGGGALKACPPAAAANFDSYSVGSTFQGLRVGPAERVCQPPSPSARAAGAPALRDNTLTYLYGTCKVPEEPEASCPYPLTVQNFPACERNLSLYRRYPSPDGESYPYTETTIRGAPAAVFDEGLRTEIYTGDSTVVIWGQRAADVRTAADQLQGLHRGQQVRASADLPAPDPGAMEGRLAC